MEGRGREGKLAIKIFVLVYMCYVPVQPTGSEAVLQIVVDFIPILSQSGVHSCSSGTLAVAVHHVYSTLQPHIITYNY